MTVKISPENDNPARAGTGTLASDIFVNRYSGRGFPHAEYPAGGLLFTPSMRVHRNFGFVIFRNDLLDPDRVFFGLVISLNFFIQDIKKKAKTGYSQTINRGEPVKIIAVLCQAAKQPGSR